MSPNTTPQEQFEGEVLPCFEAYMEDKCTIWKARCATYIVGHFAEHVWYYYKYHNNKEIVGKAGNAGNFVKNFVKDNECQEVEIIWNEAVLGKHRFSIEPNKLRHAANFPGAYEYVSTASGNVSPEFIVGTTGSVIQDRMRLKMVKYDLWFDEVLQKAVDFWRRWLKTAPIH